MKETCQELEANIEEFEAKILRLETALKKALERIIALETENAGLKKENADFKARLNRNSKNSSKPPSSDPKGNSPDQGEKPPRAPRMGKSRTPFPDERIDKHVHCTRDKCPHCGSAAIQLNNKPSEKLQQAELPDVRAIVTQYELLKYDCESCGKGSIASLPNGVPDSAFGLRLMSLVALLTGALHMAKREAALLIKDLYDVDISKGSVTNVEERVAIALNSVYERIHKFVLESSFCKHFDETGWRDRGKQHYVWLAGCEHAAFYMIDRTRSAAAFKKLIGKETCEAPSVTDRYAVYKSLSHHQYCLAHLIRDFRGYGERDGPDKSLGKALEEELRKACGIHKEYREGRCSLNTRNRRLGRCRKNVEFGLVDGIANGSDALSKLCENLLNNVEKLWRFIKTPGMEPTNNAAERDLRKLVIYRKKSYGTRSDRGMRFVERITTVVQTLKKQQCNLLKFIESAVRNFYAQAQAPFVAEAFGF